MKPIDKKTIKIRPMASSDVEPTLAIWWAEIPEKTKVASELEGPLDMSLIAEHEGTLVGLMLAKLEYTGYPMTSACVIYLIAVNPEYRKHGIGTMMIQTMEKLCKSKNIKTIRAPIPENDQAVIKYFINAGFRPSNIVNYDLDEFTGE
jgi:ribosomal protein S18 acetylase RimI-like enzyme